MTATLRRLADEGRVVVVATTSPTELDVCDQVVLLTADRHPGVRRTARADRRRSWAPPTGRRSSRGSARIPMARTTRIWPASRSRRRRSRRPQLRPRPPRSARRNVVGAKSSSRPSTGLADGRRSAVFHLPDHPAGAVRRDLAADARRRRPGPGKPLRQQPRRGRRDSRRAHHRRRRHGHGAGHPRPLRRTAHLPPRTSPRLVGVGVSGRQDRSSTAWSPSSRPPSSPSPPSVGKGAPTHGAALLGHNKLAASVELFVALAVTAIVSAMVALALSSLATLLRADPVDGGADRPDLGWCSPGRCSRSPAGSPLEQIAGLVPSRWGFAASASTVDVHAVNLLADADDSWKHSSGQWLLDMGLLIGFGVVATAALRWRLRRPARRHNQNRHAEFVADDLRPQRFVALRRGAVRRERRHRRPMFGHLLDDRQRRDGRGQDSRPLGSTSVRTRSQCNRLRRSTIEKKARTCGRRPSKSLTKPVN